jgi:transcriptional coactivator HFI1/ADA1
VTAIESPANKSAHALEARNMVDINPAALSRPSISLSTPILSNKTINVSVPSLQKAPKSSQLIPARIDLEPIYTALKSVIGAEGWAIYKEATTQFLIGMFIPHPML